MHKFHDIIPSQEIFQGRVRFIVFSVILCPGNLPKDTRTWIRKHALHGYAGDTARVEIQTFCSENLILVCTYSDTALVIICFPSTIFILHSEKPQMKISSLPNSPVWNRAYPLRNLHCSAVPEAFKISSPRQINTILAKLTFLDSLCAQSVCDILNRVEIDMSCNGHSKDSGCRGFNRW